MLISVPGGNNGPGGVLVCAENWIIWQNLDQDEVRAPIPRRAGTPDEKGLLITSYTMHKSKNLFFFLLQSELGDIYKVTLDLNGDEGTDVKVKTLHLSQFDKIK
jgi:splicing factor 3B subunit 3